MKNTSAHTQFYKLLSEAEKVLSSSKGDLGLWTRLSEMISLCDKYYYEENKPFVPDTDYDHLLKLLEKLEGQHPEFRVGSVTQKVAGKALSAFKKGDHRLPMLSLSNTYDTGEIEEFHTRVLKYLDWPENRDLEYLVEPKLDGLAIEVIYENGMLVKALTRGDGVTGEDVTENVKTIKVIPHSLNTKKPPALFEARGEILLFKKDFLELNEQQEADDEEPFANPRNAAAGSLRQLDSKITASRPLRAFFYATGLKEGLSSKDEPRSQLELEELMGQWGLPVNQETSVCKKIEAVKDFYLRLEEKRHELDYDIDGIVIKVNDLSLQQTLGTIARSPRWAVAAKFKPQQAETVIEDIHVQVGRTGALTPVALMKPVSVGGVTVTHATLHNQDEVNRKDVRIGDTVLVQRAGDVIPEVVRVVLEKRQKGSHPFKLPDHCPACGVKAERAEGEAVLRCENILCEARLKESLKHFVSRRALNVEKLGDKIIDQMVDLELVKRFSDLYHLTAQDFEKLPRQGEKSTQNLLGSIERSKKSSLARVIFGMGIRFVGEQTAKILARHFGSLDKFLNATENDLLAADEVGEKVAKSILTQIHNRHFRYELHRLVELGVEMTVDSNRIRGNANNGEAGSLKLEGLTFVITGTLSGLSRDEAKDLVEFHGGTVSSSVSKKTSYLLCGESAGSKLDKAQALGVKVISLEEFQKLIK